MPAYRVASIVQAPKDQKSPNSTKPTSDVEKSPQPAATDIEDLIPGQATHLQVHLQTQKISITQLSAQLWCERQVHFGLETKERRETRAMRLGTAHHAVYEAEDHEVVPVLCLSAEDMLATKLLSALSLMQKVKETGCCRELWVFGIVEVSNKPPILLRGIIDEVVLDSEGLLQLGDTKTRGRESLPSVAQRQGTAIQLQTYAMLMDSLQKSPKWETHLWPITCAILNLDRQAHFSDEVQMFAEVFGQEQGTPLMNLDQVFYLFLKTIRELPDVGSTLKVRYESRTSDWVQEEYMDRFSPLVLASQVQPLFEWWHGDRPSEPVTHSEKWKCNYCDFLDRCQSTPLEAADKETALQQQLESRTQDYLLDLRDELRELECVVFQKIRLARETPEIQTKLLKLLGDTKRQQEVQLFETLQADIQFLPPLQQRERLKTLDPLLRTKFINYVDEQSKAALALKKAIEKPGDLKA